MQHVRNKTGGGVIVWDKDDWKAGLGSNGLFTSAQNQKMVLPEEWAQLLAIDPFQGLNYGSLAPGKNPSVASGATNLAGPLVAGCVKDTQKIYGIDSGGKIQSYDYTTETIDSGGGFPHTISHNSHSGYVGSDAVIYRHNNNSATVKANSLFYSFYDGTDFDVGCMVGLAIGAINDTFMSTVPANPLGTVATDLTDGQGLLHPMCIGADDILYIGSGRYLHAYDGATGNNGTFSPKVLSFPQGFTIQSIVKTQTYLAIFGNYFSGNSTPTAELGEAQLYLWNYNDLDPNIFIPLEDNYVASGFVWKGNLAAITYGTREKIGNVKLKVISSNSVVKIVDFNAILPLNRGVLATNNVIYLNCGGYIVTIGDKFEDGKNFINNRSICSVSGVSGFILHAGGILADGIIASGSTGSSYSINQFASGFSNGIAFGKYFFPTFPIGWKGKIKSIEVEFNTVVTPNVSNGTLTLQFLTDMGVLVTTILTTISSVAAPIIKRFFVDTSSAPLPQFFNIAPKFIWQGGSIDIPVVSRLLVEYEDIELDANS